MSNPTAADLIAALNAAGITDADEDECPIVDEHGWCCDHAECWAAFA